MKLIRFIGDVHGKYEGYKRLIKDAPPSIQVGDMGVGFRRYATGEIHSNPPHYAMTPNHRFIRGNHDNPRECRKHSQYIPDGHLENGIMFLGGAVSIDREMRREGFSWWADEELSTEELNKLVDQYVKVTPKIMVTHDCPESVAEIMATLSGFGMKLMPEYTSRTRQAMESMLSFHRPKLWIYGHWHIPFDQIIEGTRFICLPELGFIDFDIDEA